MQFLWTVSAAVLLWLVPLLKSWCYTHVLAVVAVVAVVVIAANVAAVAARAVLLPTLLSSHTIYC